MTSPTVQLRRRRRLLALATAGLALCIGVSVTSLAAWQQNIQVSPTTDGIGSSLLRIELSLNNGPWTTATLNSNGSLNFGTNASLLTPGDTVYASIRLRAAIGSRGANVTLSGGAVSDTLINALTYAAKTGIAPADCSTTNFTTLANFDAAGTTLVGVGSLLTAGSGTTGFVVPAATSSAPGTPVGVCLAVTLPGGLGTAVSGLTTTPVWQFNATSN